MGAGVTNIRVKKLARQLGKPLPKLIEALRALGLERYAHPEAMLPAERLPAVRQALAKPAVEPDFDAMMQSMGVRPLDEDRRTPSGRHKPARAQPPKPPAAQPAVTATSVTQRIPAVRPTPPQDRPDRAADLQEALRTVQDALARVTRDLNREAQARRAAQAETASVRADLLRAQAEHQEGQARIQALEATLEAPAGGDAALLKLLANRGVHGPDEAQRAVSALLTGRRFEAMISELAAPRSGRLAAMLRDHLLLHCGRDDCPVPVGEPLVQVAEDRCEVCGGLGLQGPLEEFSDALLLAGLTRVGLQGGRPVLLRHLERHLDRRIQLRFLGEGRVRDGEPPQVFVRWLPGDRSATLVDGVVLCTDPTLSAMLRRAAQRLTRS